MACAQNIHQWVLSTRTRCSLAPSPFPKYQCQNWGILVWVKKLWWRQNVEAVLLIAANCWATNLSKVREEGWSPVHPSLSWRWHCSTHYHHCHMWSHASLSHCNIVALPRPHTAQFSLLKYFWYLRMILSCPCHLSGFNSQSKSIKIYILWLNVRKLASKVFYQELQNMKYLGTKYSDGKCYDIADLKDEVRRVQNFINN